MLQRRSCSATLTRVSGARPEKGAHFPPPKVMIVGPTSPRRKASLLNSPGLRTRRFFWSGRGVTMGPPRKKKSYLGAHANSRANVALVTLEQARGRKTAWCGLSG